MDDHDGGARQARLEHLRARVRRNRIMLATVVILAVLVASRFVHPDYADWATRRDVIVGPDSPAAAAAESFARALAAWSVSPEPSTWEALWETVVPAQRGEVLGEWPWGTPVLFLASKASPDGRCAPFSLDNVTATVMAFGLGSASRTTECDALVLYELSVTSADGTVQSYRRNSQVRLHFDRSEEEWLVSGWWDSRQ